MVAGSAESASAEASFARFGGLCAIAAGVFGVLYSVTFVAVDLGLLKGSSAGLGVGLYSFFLMSGGLLTSAALVALYNRVREVDSAFAMWGLLLSLIAAIGSAIHGAYDLANNLHPPAGSAGDFPSQIDPRGMLTFGVAGIGLFVLSWLMSRDRSFPSSLAMLGYVLAALLVIIYLGRLIVLDPKSLLILVPAALAGLIANPVWYIGLGLTLRKRD
jgi:hypothetical protein